MPHPTEHSLLNNTSEPLFVYRKSGGPLPNYNAVDGKVNRKSFMGPYEVINGVPRYARSSNITKTRRL